MLVKWLWRYCSYIYVLTETSVTHAVYVTLVNKTMHLLHSYRAFFPWLWFLMSGFTGLTSVWECTEMLGVSWVWLWVVVCVQGSSGGGDVAPRAQLCRCSAGFCQHSSVSSPQLRENTLPRSVRPAALETELLREDSHHQSRRVRADLPAWSVQHCV